MLFDTIALYILAFFIFYRFLGYIHSAYLCHGRKFSSHNRYGEVSSLPLYWTSFFFFLTCISDLCSTSKGFFGLGAGVKIEKYHMTRI